MNHARVIVTHYGGPDALQVLQEECPEPQKGEVRVRVLAAGVSLPDLMMREGIHPETPPLPFTPGWDLIGMVDRLGDSISGIEPGQIVAALPISGAYAEFVCLPQHELVPVPSGLDVAEGVSLILNYVTAYQMLHRSAKVKAGQRVLIHGAAGGVGTALLQLGRLAGLEIYGTCSSRGASAVSELGGIPIDYQHLDFVQEIHRLTSDGVDVVFDGIGGTHIWRSRKALRSGGMVVAYGLTASLRGGRLASGRSGRRHRFRAIAIFGLFIAGGWLFPGRRRVVPYSIQWLKRLKPALFRQDLITLFDLLQQRKIKPLIAQRFPLAEARHAHELLGKGGVTGKIVLVRNGSVRQRRGENDMSEPTLQAQIDAAKAYEALFVPALFGQWAPKVADAAQVQPGQRVLDVACGTGILAREVASRIGSRGQVVGIDPNPGMVAVAKQISPAVEWRQGLAESLPFPDRSFDVVVSQFGLMFFTDRRQALREMVRALAPGGRLAIAVWDSLENIPAYATEVALLEKTAGRRAADALRAPFVLGERKALATLFSEAGVASAEITTHQGTARFASIRTMVEADLRGWLPIMGVVLTEEEIGRVLQEAERALRSYAIADGRVAFDLSAHLVTSRKP